MKRSLSEARVTSETLERKLLEAEKEAKDERLQREKLDTAFHQLQARLDQVVTHVALVVILFLLQNRTLKRSLPEQGTTPTNERRTQPRSENPPTTTPRQRHLVPRSPPRCKQ